MLTVLRPLKLRLLPHPDVIGYEVDDTLKAITNSVHKMVPYRNRHVE